MNKIALFLDNLILRIGVKIIRFFYLHGSKITRLKIDKKFEGKNMEWFKLLLQKEYKFKLKDKKLDWSIEFVNKKEEK